MSDECSKQNDLTESTDQKEKHEFFETLKHKIDELRDIITVEPVLGFYQLGIFLSKPALDSLEFEKACRVNLGYNDTVCEAVIAGEHRQFSTENSKIQILISKMHSWQQPVQSFVPLLLILFLGSYSDRHKWRKPFFVIPLVGDLLGSLGCILCVLNMTTWSLEVQGIFQKVVPSLSGSLALVNMAATAYVADVSSVETRTFRMGIITVCNSVTVLLANATSGVLFVIIGYKGILSLSSLMLVLALIYGVFWVKETRTTNKDESLSLVADLINPKHAIDTFRVIFKKSSEASHLHAMLLLVTLHRAAYDGDNSILYLYVQNVFQWTVVDYSYFLTANSTVSFIGNILGLCLFVKILGTADLIILFIPVFTRALSNIVFCCARSSAVFYIDDAVLLSEDADAIQDTLNRLSAVTESMDFKVPKCTITGVVSNLYRITKRSYGTKIVSKEDIGKTQSLFSIAEALSPALAVPLYNLIYVHTLQIFPAATLFLSTFLYIVCCCIIVWMYYNTNKKTEIQNEILEGQGQYKKMDIENVHM